MRGCFARKRLALVRPARSRRIRHTRVMTPEVLTPRIATVAGAQEIAGLLDRFNREFDTPSPGPAVLTARLQRLLSGPDVVALLAGDPAVGVALLTLRPNVWCQGPVALLDELYVAPAQRGRGIGAALLKAAEAVVRERGGELLEINVDGEDTDARRFYERYGYTDRDPEQTQPQLYYHRNLAPPD
jgi:GNAT superfamily N-acetyltransferase